MDTQVRGVLSEELSYERTNFKQLIAANPNYFGSLGKEAGDIVKDVAYNIFYEEITSIGYHPDLRTLEATIHVKQPYGFSGNLCAYGSHNYVRFYLNYGAGWEDQGLAAINTHDIPTEQDCAQRDEKPLSYVASLEIKPKAKFCEYPVLPRARAILSWNIIPPANTPDWPPVWGNVYECNVQIAPIPKFYIHPDFNLAKLFEVSLLNPSFTLAQAAETIENGKVLLDEAVGSMKPTQPHIAELIKMYENPELQVSPARYGLNTIKSLQIQSDIFYTNEQKEYLTKLGFNWQQAFEELFKTTADISYEELTDVGLDYNQEKLVASVHVKKPAGYSGQLCNGGSYEYVAFWADWDNSCKWEYLGNSSVKVYDFTELPDGGLCYSVILPYNFMHHRKNCDKPNVVKIRAVLSWNHPSSTTDPDALETYGNLIDRYIQIKPGEEIPEGTVKPVINILGGIPVDKISDMTGLTTSGAAFALTAIPVESGAPFAGKVVLQGPCYPGYKYRIKATNLATSASYYLSDPLWLVGSLPEFPWVQYTTITPDASGFYTFQDFDKNTDNILARWTPGTDDKWMLELEIQGVAGIFTKVIQMDNTLPTAVLNIYNDGDCTHYHLGDTITGDYTASDNYLSHYSLGSSFVGTIESGTTNTVGNSFAFTTDPNGTPCGSINLYVYEKTIHNSSYTGVYSPAGEIVCLKQ